MAKVPAFPQVAFRDKGLSECEDRQVQTDKIRDALTTSVRTLAKNTFLYSRGNMPGRQGHLGWSGGVLGRLNRQAEF
jgi:hypothetical protein